MDQLLILLAVGASPILLSIIIYFLQRMVASIDAMLAKHDNAISGLQVDSALHEGKILALRTDLDRHLDGR